MPHGQRIAEFLLDTGAVKVETKNPFTWTSGLKAPIYCDNRMLFSHPSARRFITDALVQRVRTLHIPADVIAGTATAAIGWAALVADRLDLPFVYVRPKAKEHGAKKRVEGELRPGKDVVVVEDLISTGGSAMETVKALREEGKAVVSDVVAIFSYELISSREGALVHGVKLHPLATVRTLIEVGSQQGRFSDEDVSSLERFIEDPEEWFRVSH